jgi:hypothetical protein
MTNRLGETQTISQPLSMPQRRSCRACYYAHTWSIENSHVVHFPDALHLTHLRPCALNLLPLVPNNADQKGGKKTQQDGTQRPSLRQRIGLPTPCQNSITLYSKLMDQKCAGGGGCIFMCPPLQYQTLVIAIATC